MPRTGPGWAVHPPAGADPERLDLLPSVAEVAVVGSPSPEWGETVTAFVVPAGAPPDRGELLASPPSGWPPSSGRGSSTTSTRCRATRSARCRSTSCARRTAAPDLDTVI